MKHMNRIVIVAAIALAFGAGALAWEFLGNRTVPQKTPVFIGAEKAQALALQRAGLQADDVRFDRTELDKERNVWQYEVEFKHGGKEYSADVNAETGAILKWGAEWDD